MDKFDNYRTAHLFLLVGSNPLPNIVAGILLSQEKGVITLLYSKETAEVARVLKAALENYLETRQIIPEEVEESNPSSIAKKTLEQLKKHEAVQSIGLNYTGGTKAMAVHAYQTIRQWIEREGVGKKAVYSYLDARNLRMVFDPVKQNEGGQSPTVPIGNSVKIHLEHLLRLHNWKLPAQDRPITTPILLDTARLLMNVNVTGGNKFNELKAWRDNIGGKEARKLPPPDREAELARVTITLPTALPEIKNSLSSALDITGDTFTAGDAARRLGITASTFYNWIAGGGWLESIVLAALHECAGRFDLHDICMNLKPHLPKNSKANFEFDVAAVRGYQLFAFSCSASNSKQELKMKLFEAIIRARQLGGDEACIALVSCSQNPQWLEDDIRDASGLKGRVKVFGIRDLKDMKNRIADWIKENG